MSFMHFMLCIYIVTDRRRTVILEIDQHKNATKKKEKETQNGCIEGPYISLLLRGKKKKLLLSWFPGSALSSFW